MHNIIKDLPWYDKLQYAIMLIMAAAMPIGFHVGLWAALALAVVSVVKIVAMRRIGNPALSWMLRIPLLALIAYWLLHLISVAYGGDVAVGMRVVELKAVLLIFPLCFLLTDTSYLDSRRICCLFYALLLSVVCVFFYFVVVAIGRLVDGASWAAVTNSTFDSRHHAYIAMYVDSALVFIYIQLSLRWSEMRRWAGCLLFAAVPLCVLYVLLVNSRAGVVVMWTVTAVALVYYLWLYRRWWRGLVFAVLFAGYTLGMGWALPGYSDRIQSTIDVVADEERTDARVEITRSAVLLALERPIFGHGAGSYRSDLVDQYDEDDFTSGVGSGYNAHDQYVETVLSVGVVGLILLLLFLLWPLWQAWRLHRHFLPVLQITIVFCANLLFESMLERQMGLLYIGYFMSLMALLINTEENKFGRYLKK